MTIIKALTSTIATIVLLLALAVTSNALLDVYLPQCVAGNTAATVDSTPKDTATSTGEVTPSAGACIDAKGEKQNWPWANAPTLWPRCKDDAPPPVPTKKEN